MAEISCLQVDAFTDRPFAGNPAAVCLLEEDRDEQWMQAVAAEMNLSETAFVRPLEAAFGLRWFTPAVEVELCGHATLASAHVLWSEQVIGNDEPIEFHTKSGVLTCSRQGDVIELDFPAAAVEPAEPPAELAAVLGATPSFVGQSGSDLFVVVDSEQILRQLQPDFSRMRELGVRAVMVTSAADEPQFDFVSRFFGPGVGIDEDPVTGSAHCSLGPFWATRLGKTDMTAFQASSRGGVVRVRVAGDRVLLGGQAVTVSKGVLFA